MDMQNLIIIPTMAMVKNEFVTVQSVAVLFLATVLVFISVISLQHALASARVLDADRQFKTWYQDQHGIPDQQWTAIRKAYLAALEQNGTNPEYLHKLGVTYEGLFINSGVASRNADTDRRLALDYYRKAVMNRPSWPIYWIDLALVKFRLGEMDREFYQAYDRALQLGQWEPGVIQVAVDIGLYSWPALTTSRRASLLALINAALRQPFSPSQTLLLAILERYSNRVPLCEEITGSDQFRKYCAE